MAYRLNLRRDAIRWLRQQRAKLYVGMLMQARVQQFYLSFSCPAARPRRECARSSPRKTRGCRPWKPGRLGANGSVFASPQVRGLYELLFAEAWPVELNPGRFRTDETRLEVLGRTAGILVDLEAAIRRELGADSRQRFGSVTDVGLAKSPI